MHLGDFCNDYKGSSEIVNAYINNKYNIPVYGIYGNHELESEGNSVELVTLSLTNQNVNFGNDEGYWHYDFGDFRLIGLDNNYSYNPELEAWEHNRTASHTSPKGNLYPQNMSIKEIEWFGSVLREADMLNKKVIIFSHNSISDKWNSMHNNISEIWRTTHNYKLVVDLLKEYNNCILMCLNGHLHTDHFKVENDIAYFDVNSAINGYWANMSGKEHHYKEGQTFNREIFDKDGKVVGYENVELTSLNQGRNTWFFTKPLSAVVEINVDGMINIKGSTTDWMYGIKPLGDYDGVKPCIENRRVQLCKK